MVIEFTNISKYLLKAIEELNKAQESQERIWMDKTGED